MYNRTCGREVQTVKLSALYPGVRGPFPGGLFWFLFWPRKKGTACRGISDKSDCAAIIGGISDKLDCAAIIGGISDNLMEVKLHVIAEYKTPVSLPNKFDMEPPSLLRGRNTRLPAEQVRHGATLFIKRAKHPSHCRTSSTWSHPLY